MAIRFDTATLGKPQKDPKTGWLRVDAYVARTGVLPYLKPNGKVFREYRAPEEVFHEDALKSFDLVPFTNGHPPGLLDAKNTHEHQRGTVFQPRKGENGHLAATILVTHEDTIKDIESGKLQVSVGYLADVVEGPGEIDGEHYDGVQKNIRANHVALVEVGRAGETVAIKFDGADTAVLLSEADSSGNRQTAEKAKTVKIHFDSAEIEVPEDIAKLVVAEREAQAAKLSEETSKVQKEAARADAAEAALNTVKAELAEAPAKAKAAIEARVSLETKARELAPDEKFDGLSDLEVKKLVAEKVHGIKFDGKPESYIEASFDLAIAKAGEPTEPLTEKLDRKDAPKSRAQMAAEILNSRSQIKQ